MTTSNKYIANSEKNKLANYLQHGETVRFKYPFTKKEHRMIFDNLQGFMANWPRHQHNVENFLYYLRECHVLDVCGGEVFVRDIFNGIEVDAE